MSAQRKESWRAWQSWGTWHEWPTRDEPPVLQEWRKELPIRDQYGLAAWAQRFPNEVRRRLAVALRRTGGSLDHPPTTAGYGTVPELVVMGGLFELGFKSAPRGFIGHSNRSFIFQSKLLGGRKPGGAVADFIVFNNLVTTAVRVDSIYHNLESPFGGGVATEKDKIQALRLQAEPFVDRVVDVNRKEDGYPLEHGPEAAINRDFLRILGKA